MPGTGEINGSQSFKLTIENYRTNNVANNGARANAPAALNNAQPAAAPQPAVAQAQQPKKGFFAWIMSFFRSAEPAPAPEPRVAAPQVPPHKQFNDRLFKNVDANAFAALPQNFRDALMTLEEALRAKFGETIVVKDDNLCEQLTSTRCKMTRMKALVDQANAAGREITVEEIVQEYTARANQLFVEAAIGEKFAAMCNAGNVALGGSPLSQGALIAKRHPEIAEELCRCNTPAEIAQALKKHSEKFSALVETRRAINEATAGAGDSCCEKLASALGMHKSLVSSMVEMVKLKNKILELGNQMMGGTYPGCMNPGFSAKAALEKVVDDFVDGRARYLAEIDQINVGEDVKQRWKATVLNANSLPVMRPAQVMQLAAAVNLGKFDGALDSRMPLKLRCDIFTDLNRELRETMLSVLGDQAFKKLGAEEFTGLTTLAEDIALSGKPALLQKIRDAKTMLSDDVYVEMSRTANTGASTFVSSLLVVIQSTAENPLTSEPRFSAAIEKQIDAALAESGVADAKLVADVKKALVAQGKGVLKGATTLAALSAFVDSVKDQAQVLAQTLAAVARGREGAKSLAATTIAFSTGLGKGFVLNNLDTSSIASASGKLRFLYDDIVSQAKKGPVDYVANVNKANDIITKFANDKIAILKAIDEAGFDVADRANYIMDALKSSTWRDASVVPVAKALAESANIRAAFKAIAGVRDPEQAAKLAAKGIAENFRIFAQTFSHEILSKYPEMAQKMIESSDLQQILQMMTTSLLAKEMPEMSASLARLAEAGKLSQIRKLLCDAMNEMRSLKMDYMTLEQYGLVGEPNGEKLRGTLHNPNLVFNQAKYDKCVDDDATLNIANTFFGMMTADFPTKTAFADADKYIARKLIGGGMVTKYSEGLSQEAVPILKNLVDRLDWRPNFAMESDAIVRGFVEDLKNWRDIAPGSADSAGLENVLQRRMNGYMTDALKGLTQQAKIINVGGMEVFSTFSADISRGNTYVLNGTKMQIKSAAEMVGEIKQALGNDPAKLKAVSVVFNQQIFGDFTAAVPNKLALAGWRAGQEDEDIANIPNIEKFASRDINLTGYPLFQTGAMTFELDVAPDGNSAKIRAKTESKLCGDKTLMAKGQDVGKCIITQEFTLEFGNEPVIKDLKIGQTFA
ncbi:MAG: hypothetical protein IJG18_00815 [Kiritimatiellae bacterium]|nr:hypothetical protein [Kiritimatiellia bacterium]